MLHLASAPLPPFTENELILLTLLLLFSYLLGSIPTGLLIGKVLGVADIRKQGSGNIGATNMLRVGGKFPAIITLGLDIFKTQVPILAASIIFQHANRPLDAIYLAACFAFIGHVFPIWLKGKGGKVVACYIAILVTLHPIFALIFSISWIATFALKRIVSLSSLMGIFASVLATFLLPIHDPKFIALLVVISLISVFAHRENIARLAKNKELTFK